MNFDLTHDQYRTMCEKFPGVESYITRCWFRNEFDRLEQNEYILNDFEKGRLEFLREYRSEFKTF